MTRRAGAGLCIVVVLALTTSYFVVRLRDSSPQPGGIAADGLRRIHNALAVYAEEHDGLLPPSSDPRLTLKVAYDIRPSEVDLDESRFRYEILGQVLGKDFTLLSQDTILAAAFDKRSQAAYWITKAGRFTHGTREILSIELRRR